MSSMVSQSFRSGIVAVVGRPNVGKSSLMNSLLEYKLSIVSAKPQTTRDNIQGLYNDDQCQILFVDTPGIHRPEHKLGERLVDRALSQIGDADLVLFVITFEDRPFWSENRRIIEVLRETKTPLLLAVNKIDLHGSKERILPLIEEFSRELPFAAVVPVSARRGINRDLLLEEIVSRLPEGAPLYPDDMITDRSERFIAAEVIREKAIALTDQEVPHSVAVDIEEYKSPDEYPDRDHLLIRATIYVERDGQKAILLGKKGEKMKAIGSAARQTLTELTGHPVYLDLWVKVHKGWRNSECQLKQLGYGE